jgi:hypothetical protein
MSSHTPPEEGHNAGWFANRSNGGTRTPPPATSLRQVMQQDKGELIQAQGSCDDWDLLASGRVVSRRERLYRHKLGQEHLSGQFLKEMLVF